MGYNGYRRRKRRPIEQLLGECGNPYPAGPFDKANLDKIVIYQSQVRYRGTTRLIAYRKDLVPDQSSNDYGDYVVQVKWDAGHKDMIEVAAAGKKEKVGNKWFKSSLTNATFQEIQEDYTLYKTYQAYTD
jgi:hypothetical protein